MAHDKRRDRLEIIRCILSLCKKNESTKTKIVYRANLNFKTAGIYLNWLINKELVVQEEDYFKLTTKGTGLLSSLHDMSPFFNEKL